MDELAATERDADVRRAWRHRFEEHEITGSDVGAVDRRANAILLLHLARQSRPMLCEYPLHESAAIES
jgi:hypothetical protein